MVGGGYETTQLTYDDLADDAGFCTYVSTDVSALYPADMPATRFDIVPPAIVWLDAPTLVDDEPAYVGTNKQTVQVAFVDHTLNETSLLFDGYTFAAAQNPPNTPDAVEGEPYDGAPTLAVSIPWPDEAQTGIRYG